AADAGDAAAGDQAPGRLVGPEDARGLERVVAVAVDAEEADAESQLVGDADAERGSGVIGRAVLRGVERPLRRVSAGGRVEASAHLVLLVAGREDAEAEREPRLELAREGGGRGDRDDLEVAAVV